MKRYFPLDSKTQQYFEIAKTIKHFYPAGLSPFNPGYHKCPGIEELNGIMGNNIADNKTFRKRWGTFLGEVRKESGKKVHGTTGGFVPAYSGDLILETSKIGSLIYTKHIAFAVSLIGPYFTICGIDETCIREDHDNFPMYYCSFNCTTASPYKEFENDFNGIRYLIEKKFPGYKFVPFFITMMYLKDIQTLHYIGEEETVYNALFNGLFNYYTHYRSRGDEYYGMEKNSNIKITLSPPLSDI